jgi:poly(3-hydroxyalkanoate) synthetase
LFSGTSFNQKKTEAAFKLYLSTVPIIGPLNTNTINEFMMISDDAKDILAIQNKISTKKIITNTKMNFRSFSWLRKSELMKTKKEVIRRRE